VRLLELERLSVNPRGAAILLAVTPLLPPPELLLPELLVSERATLFDAPDEPLDTGDDLLDVDALAGDLLDDDEEDDDFSPELTELFDPEDVDDPAFLDAPDAPLASLLAIVRLLADRHRQRTQFRRDCEPTCPDVVFLDNGEYTIVRENFTSPQAVAAGRRVRPVEAAQPRV
jgi:hypothetical protein